ncbi:hypothetical protein [Rhizobium sp. CSW-27]|uniref:hypothetical protein n=1 Tax=Rhizobium sp. CSW-27 TaxID=2839985 RepID=UPI001C01B1CE|nr:hypothetical protein [Rhizobium sp. CSW-27]MBT9369345.1 hypothetical protein [Rhizobium sp. CSW-27]
MQIRLMPENQAMLSLDGIKSGRRRAKRKKAGCDATKKRPGYCPTACKAMIPVRIR